MSVQTQINRIKNNVTSSLDKVRAKGVTVPTNASSDDLPVLIKSISTGIDTSNGNAEATDIAKDKIAYVKGVEVKGTFTLDSELSTQDSLISQIQTALQNKASGSSGTKEEWIFTLDNGSTVTKEVYVE